MKEKLLSMIPPKTSFSKMDLVDELLSLYSDYYEEDIEQNVDALELVDYIRQLLPNVYGKRGSLEKRMKWLEELELFHVEGGLEKNHKEVIEIFNALNKVLSDKDVKFYHASGFMAYLLSNNALERFHHDVDLMMSEEEYAKLNDKLEDELFTIHEHWGHRGDGNERRVVHLFYKEYNIPISIVLYENKKEGIVINDYIRVNNEIWVEKALSSRENVELCLTQTPVICEGDSCMSLTLEAIYSAKMSDRVKDAYDRRVMQQYIDEKKLQKIIETSNVIVWREKVFDASLLDKLNDIGNE